VRCLECNTTWYSPPHEDRDWIPDAELGRGQAAGLKPTADIRGDWPMGHWRAISPGIERSMTVTSGTLATQVRAVRDLDLSDSQADSAGSVIHSSR